MKHVGVCALDSWFNSAIRGIYVWFTYIEILHSQVQFYNDPKLNCLERLSDRALGMGQLEMAKPRYGLVFIATSLSLTLFAVSSIE